MNKKISVIVVVILCASFLSCQSISSGQKKVYHVDYVSASCKGIYDEDGTLVYSINEAEARINWKTLVKENYLLYLSAKDELVVMDLAKKEKVLVIDDVGDYAVSDDLKYICLGRKLKDSKYTTTPALYDFSKKKFISLKKMDYSFLESKIGISTDIRFNSDDNGFFVNYQWDYSDPDYIFYISLKKFELSRIK